MEKLNLKHFGKFQIFVKLFPSLSTWKLIYSKPMEFLNCNGVITYFVHIVKALE